MRVALFGGSFNPVHNGHVNLVKEVADAVKLDRVIVMPTYISPFKKNDSTFVADGCDRLEMCRLAFENIGIVTVSSYELSKPCVSYSIDTVTYLKSQFPDDDMYMIIGSDMLLSFDNWHRYRDILKLCTLIAASRLENQQDIFSLEQKAAELRQYGNIITVNTSPVEVSSTQIREKIMKNQDISCYVPKNVVKYILYKKIYDLK